MLGAIATMVVGEIASDPTACVTQTMHYTDHHSLQLVNQLDIAHVVPGNVEERCIYWKLMCFISMLLSRYIQKMA